MYRYTAGYTAHTRTETHHTKTARVVVGSDAIYRLDDTERGG